MSRVLGALNEPGLPAFIFVSTDFSGHAWAGCHACPWQSQLHGQGEVESGGGPPSAETLAVATRDAWRHSVERGHVGSGLGAEVWRGRTDALPGVGAGNQRVSLVALDLPPGTEIVVSLRDAGADS